MTPKKPRPQPELDGLPTTDHMDRLCAAVEKIAEEMERIRTSLDLLWDRVDYLVDDFGWGLINDKFRCDRPARFESIASMSVNPLAKESREKTDTPIAHELEEPAPVQGPAIAAKPRMRDLFS